MSYIPSSGSVVAFQGNPSVLQTLSQISNTTANPVPIQPPASGTLPVVIPGSVITVQQGSVGAVIIGGSIAASFTPPANQSVSGTVQTDVRGSIAAVIIGGSIATSSPANQSVSGTIQVGNFPTTQNVSGSVIAFPTGQYTVVSSIAGGIFPISGSVAATITNTNLNVSGSVVAFGFPTNQNVSGSVVSFQGTSPWLTVPTSGSVIANQGGTRITSLVSTVPSSVIVGTSIFGQLPGGTAVLGSVAALQGTNPWVTVPTSGSVISTQSGTWSTSVMTNVITSIATAGQVMGSVATLQGTNPWIVNFQNSSIIAINAGSVITITPGSVLTLPIKTGGSSVYTVLSSITAVSIMAANSARVGGTIYNNANTPVYIGLGVTPVVTTSIFTTILQPNDYYELPYGWSSVVGGITASTTGGLLTVTEIKN